jgi:hypothetical protein
MPVQTLLLSQEAIAALPTTEAAAISPNMKCQDGFPNVRVLPAVLISLLLPLFIASLKADANAPRLDLSGIVKSAEAPVEGANVFIYTAGPRVGPGDI